MGASSAVQRRLLTVSEYHRMGAAGVLEPDDRVELIEGELIEMAPIGSRHLASVNRILRLLIGAVGDSAIVSVQNPIALPPLSEPQPDISLLRARADDYSSALPAPHDVFLVIEVAESSLSYDRDTKALLYARHGIAEFWLVNVIEQTLTVYSDPSPTGYRRATLTPTDAVIAPALLPAAKISMRDLWWTSAA